MKLQKLGFVVAVLATMLAISATCAACTNASVTGVWGFEIGTSVGQFKADGNGSITAGDLPCFGIDSNRGVRLQQGHRIGRTVAPPNREIATNRGCNELFGGGDTFWNSFMARQISRNR